MGTRTSAPQSFGNVLLECRAALAELNGELLMANSSLHGRTRRTRP